MEQRLTSMTSKNHIPSLLADGHARTHADALDVLPSPETYAAVAQKIYLCLDRTPVVSIDPARGLAAIESAVTGTALNPRYTQHQRRRKEIKWSGRYSIRPKTFMNGFVHRCRLGPRWLSGVVRPEPG